MSEIDGILIVVAIGYGFATYVIWKIVELVEKKR